MPSHSQPPPLPSSLLHPERTRPQAAPRRRTKGPAWRGSLWPVPTPPTAQPPVSGRPPHRPGFLSAGLKGGPQRHRGAAARQGSGATTLSTARCAPPVLVGVWGGGPRLTVELGRTVALLTGRRAVRGWGLTSSPRLGSGSTGATFCPRASGRRPSRPPRGDTREDGVPRRAAHGQG